MDESIIEVPIKESQFETLEAFREAQEKAKIPKESEPVVRTRLSLSKIRKLLMNR